MSRTLFVPKLTSEHKLWIENELQSKKTTKEIHAGLLEEFSLPEDFISLSRISQICSKLRKAQRVRKPQSQTITESVVSKPITTVELEQIEEAVAVAKDLKTVLAAEKISKSKIESIYYGYENHPEQDAWALLEFLTINGIAPSVQRRIVLNFFGLDVVKKIWPSSKHSTLKKVVEDPTATVNEIQQNRIMQLKHKIALDQLKETYEDISSKNKKSDNPMVGDLKERIEETQLQRQWNALKKETQQDDTFLNTVKGLKELGLLGNNQKSSEESTLVQVLQTQLTMAQKQSEDYRRSLEVLRDTSTQHQINALETRMSLQLTALQDKTMSLQDWEAIEQRKWEWAKEKKLTKVGSSKEDQALSRIEKVSDRVDKFPDSISKNLDKSLDNLINTFDKLSSIQEKRKLQNQRREYMQQLQLKGSGTFKPGNNPANNPDKFLDNLEKQIDEQATWAEINKKGDILDPKEKKNADSNDPDLAKL